MAVEVDAKHGVLEHNNDDLTETTKIFIRGILAHGIWSDVDGYLSLLPMLLQRNVVRSMFCWSVGEMSWSFGLVPSSCLFTVDTR